MKWYVLHVRTAMESEIKAEIKRLGYTAAVPIETRTGRKGGIWRNKDRVVLPGYVFLKVELTDQDYYKIRSIPGVIRFLGPGRPEPIHDSEANYIDWLANDDSPLEPSGVLLSEGNKVTIQYGPLAGYAGTITRINRRQRRALLSIIIAGHRQEFSLSVNILRPDQEV